MVCCALSSPQVDKSNSSACRDCRHGRVPLVVLNAVLVVLTGHLLLVASDCPPLSKEYLSKYAKSGTVIIGVSDWSIYQIFGKSWVRNWQAIGVGNVICGAADAKTAEALANANVPCFDAAAGVQGKDEYKWGDAAWGAMTWHKVLTVQQILKLGFNVIFSDMDVVWWRDPLPYFEQHMADFDFLVSSDAMRTGNPKGDDGPDMAAAPYGNVNTGVYMLKASKGGEELVKGWLAVQPSHGGNDQTGFYVFMRANPGPYERRGFTVADGKARMGVLPITSFMHSYSYLIERAHTDHGVKPYELHTVWGFGGIVGKKHRMREVMMYDDPPEYFNPPALMTVDLSYPPTPDGYNDWTDNEDMIQFHLKAMDSQLRQLWHAMAVAMTLRRVLVLPKLRCYCINNWFGSERCRIPGDTTTIFPFNCSLGQATRAEKLYEGIRVANYTLEFREHTFLENPRTPASVRDGHVWVVLASDLQCKNCAREGTHHDNHQQLAVNSMMEPDDLLDALAPYKGTQVLRFLGIEKLLKRFGDDAKHKEYHDQLVGLTQKWCCRGPNEVKALNKTLDEWMHIHE